MTPELFTVADAEWYAPLSVLADRPPLLVPARIPRGWTSSQSGLWTVWSRDSDEESAPGAGSRVSVRVAVAVMPVDRADSADSTGHVSEALDVFAEACFRHRISFRHIRTEAVYRHIRGRHGSAGLADQFGVAYPASESKHEDLLRELAGEAVFEDVDGASEDCLPVVFPDGVQRIPADGSMLAAYRPKPVPPSGHRLQRLIAARPGSLSYLATDATGRTVFVKQARGSGALDGEWETLSTLHEAAPGLCPRPRGRSAHDGREYLVTEAVPGVPARVWVVKNTPLTDPGATPEEWTAYYRRVEDLLAQVRRGVETLRANGHGDAGVSPEDILIDRDDTVRLTGFRTDGSSTGSGHLALYFLSPLGQVVEQSPEVLPHIRSYLRERGPLPETLWSAVTAGRPAAAARGDLPGPLDVARDRRAALTELRDGVAAGILDAAREDRSDSVFPTVPQGFETNTLSVAYGDAGVVHALRVAGVRVPDRIIERLRRDALSRARVLAPGLYTGLAGIAWVLADFGHLQEALDLLRAADRHPLTQSSATLAWGGSGVAMAHLALYRHTGDDHHLDRACALTEFPDAYADQTPLLGPNDSTGLWYGRTGLAHAMQQVAAVIGDEVLLKAGVALLHAELERAAAANGAGIVFPASATDRRALYYLHRGTAGFLVTAARYLADAPDERLHAALPGLVAQCEMPYVAHAGLGQGLSGLGYALADCGRVLGHEAAREAALRMARGLFQHAIPDRRPDAGPTDYSPTNAGPTSMRFLGDLRLRASCDLWSGSAGVLLFLAALLDPVPDPLFTVDVGP